MKQHILIVSFAFITLLKPFIAHGQQWSALGTGLIGNGQYDRVNSLCNDSLHNRLWATGIFQIAGSDSVHNVAWWNGSIWHPLQSIIVSGDTIEYGLDMEITSSIIFQNRLIFSIDKSLAFNRWLLFEMNEDSISNRFIGSFNKDIKSMCIYHDTLYVAGEFTNYQSVPAGTTINVSQIAKWNGTDFVDVGGGIQGIKVNALCVYNDKLVAGGLFEYAGTGVYCKNIAQWDGATWSPIGNGIGQAGNYDDVVRELCEYKGKLYAGGIDITALGNDLVVWNGANWSGAANIFVDVGALKVFNNKLYVGAGATNLNWPFDNVAVYNDTVWSSTGKGPTIASSPAVNDFAIYNGALYAGGLFKFISDSPVIYAGYVARYDPSLIQDTAGISQLAAGSMQFTLTLQMKL